MNQTSAKIREALRLQLESVGENYLNDPHSEEAQQRLVHTLQTNDCREILAAVVDGADLASTFVSAGGSNHVDILEAFLHHGMNISIKNKNNWTALMYASCNGYEQCVRFLLDHSASVDIQNKAGYTALMFTSMNGHTKIVEMLLEKNANPDIQNSIGRTALMYASEFSHKEIIQLLLNHNADIDLKNRDGKTALDLAEDEEVKELLTNHANTSYLLK